MSEKSAEGMSLLFVTIAGEQAGFGHLNRCLSLAARAPRNASVNFLVIGDERASATVLRAGYRCTTSSLGAIGATLGSVAGNGRLDAAIIDVSHPSFLDRGAEALNALAQLRARAGELFLVDALMEQALVVRFPESPVDVVVTPYVGALPPAGGWERLGGAEYAVLSPHFANAPSRVARTGADRVLVTCGGSDPMKLSISVLRGLELAEGALEIRLVIGPLFAGDLKSDLIGIAGESRHRISLIPAPDDLFEQMVWCDVAVAASGLTKYELAATGTPAILMSISDVDHRINAPFAKIGSSVDLGVRPSPEEIARAVTGLLGSEGRRAEMAAAGQKQIDGKGAERLMTRITRDRIASV